MATIRAADGGYLLNSEQFNYTKDAQGRPVLNVVGGGGGTGQDGKDGITPTIGANGNWYLGDEDTGKPSRGETGPQGADGKDGTNGTDGTDGHTPVITASKSGKVTTIKVDGEAVATVNDGADGTDGTDGAPGKDGVTPNIKIGTVTTLPAGSAATASMGGTAAQPTLNLGIPSAVTDTHINELINTAIPTALKNPHPLNIKIGDTTTSYDGSVEKTVEIPNGDDILPPFTTADNDKVLGIVNGALAWVAKA